MNLLDKDTNQFIGIVMLGTACIFSWGIFWSWIAQDNFILVIVGAIILPCIIIGIILTFS